MLSKELKKIINLSKKTGDRVIVFDALDPENSFVVMDITAYEKLVEKNSLEKEIDLGDKKLMLDEKIEEKAEEKTINNKEEQDLTEEDLTDKINKEISLWKNQENQSFVTEEDRLEKNNKPWSISSKVKQKAKEVE